VNLIDALEIIRNSAGSDSPAFRVFLACGFTPLHLQTFLNAELCKALSNHCIEIKTGLFGDLAGSLERLHMDSFDAVAIQIEWPDIDPRLGIRSLGGWRSTDLPDIIQSSKEQVDRINSAVARLSERVPTICSMPTLPLPPMFLAKTEESGMHELQLRLFVSSLATSLAQKPGIRILNAQAIDELSPPAGRMDAKSEIMTGFPYKLAHASALASIVARLICSPTPKKALITDLDDTLWAGTLGEVGVDNVCWRLDQHAQGHGIYQQFLASLASAGVLIAVASKNDAALVERAFDRKDLLLAKENVFPFEVHWSRKSDSVRRILDVWNISADSVVFVDDSLMELAEVKAVFPDIECLAYPGNDYQAIWNLLKHLRDFFGRNVLTEEDTLRLASIRTTSHLRESAESGGQAFDDFLQNVDAEISFSWAKDSDQRAYELVNKTNQFNLNGRRWTEGIWKTYLGEPDAFMLTVSYKDKYGFLGRIAVMLGKARGKNVRVESWVMSCRAFSRRIEYHCLKYLFEKFEADEITFDYQNTDRNEPLQAFFRQLTGSTFAPPFRLSKTLFEEQAPPLFHAVEEVPYG